MKHISFYDSLPAASDAAVFITVLGWVLWSLFPSGNLVFFIWLLALVLALIYALSVRSALLGKKHLHDTALPPVETIKQVMSDQNILLQEQAHEKGNWEAYVQQYGLGEELHTKKGIQKTVIATALGYWITALLVTWPYAFLAHPQWVSMGAGVVVSGLIAYYSMKITGRRWYIEFLRAVTYLGLLILCFEGLKKIIVAA